MDFDSVGDRLKEIQVTEESMDEVPKILSPEIQDVFHVFASMLDIKSFMKLAIRSRDMYKRCMENNAIRINVDVNSLIVSNKNGSVEFDFTFAIVPRRYYDDFIAALRRLKCEVNIRSLEIRDFAKPAKLPGVQRYMKEIGVKKVNTLNVPGNFKQVEMVITFVEDFGVNFVYIDYPMETDVLRSLLQLKLERLACLHEFVPVDFILEIDSPIREIYFPEVRNISKEELLKILERIQSGVLNRLMVYRRSVQWHEFNTLPYDFKGPLPDERPLLFSRTPRHTIREYWFLHWNGGVTKCAICQGALEIYKCEPWELPYILRKDEDVLKDLAEKRPSVSCSSNHFRAFSEGLTMVEPTHEDPLPDIRPLYCKAFEAPLVDGILLDLVYRPHEVSKNHFWMLDEDDNLMNCKWEDGCATWKPYRPHVDKRFGNSTLAKYMFWKTLRQVEGPDKFELHCEGLKEFYSWFDNLNKLDFGYSGALPSSRPLFFDKEPSCWRKGHIRMVLLDEDRLLQCDFDNNQVRIQRCHYLNRPPILFTGQSVLEMLKEAMFENVNNIRLDVFRDGLEQLKQSVLVLQKRILISETAETEVLYMNEGAVRKATWKEGHLTVSIANLSELPSSLVKQVFKYSAENDSSSSFNLELEEFRSCLDQFTVVPFNYSGPLKPDSPTAFVKNDIRHTCTTRRSGCKCSEICLLVWFLWDGMRLTKCSWGQNEPKRVCFGVFASEIFDIPHFLMSKEYLKILLQCTYDESSRFRWFRWYREFYASLKDYVKLPFDYNGPLPDKRPIVFTEGLDYQVPVCTLLLDDGTIIKCMADESSVLLSLCSPGDDYFPPSVMSMS